MHVRVQRLSRAGWMMLFWLAAGSALAGTAQPAGATQVSASAAAARIRQATALEHGEGVPKDELAAAALYCQGAAEKDPEAAFHLAWMYANGRGVNRDDDIAYALFRQAADGGQVYARKMLVVMNAARPHLPACAVPPPPPPPAAAGVQALPGSWAKDPAHQKVIAIVNQLAPQYGIDPRLALAIINAESGFNPGAKSDKNAQGLMQLIPQTAERFQVRKIMDPEQNIRGGLAYLRWLMAFFKGDVRLVTAAYNAGEKAVERYSGIPPYAETQNYVARVTALYTATTHQYDQSVTDPSPLVLRRPMTVAFNRRLAR